MADLRITPYIKSPEIIDVTRPFSNFSYIEEKFKLKEGPIYRIFSQARCLGFKTLIVEEIKSVGFSEEDDIDLQEAGLEISKDPLIRASFFNTTFKSIEELKKQDPSNFLGYAVFKQIPFGKSYRWIVFESVIKPSQYENNYIHGKRDYTINVAGTSFNAKGILYCQQNALTNVCAHVALRTCISMLIHSGDCSYRMMNKILADNKQPHGLEAPLSTSQILMVLDNFEINYTLQTYNEMKSNPPAPYQAFLYGSVESGYPALFGFALGDVGHIIPIFGHTFNEDTWVPNAEKSYFKIGEETRYIQSESWVSTYICHDDNFGSYYCLPRQYLSSEHKMTVIATRPKRAKYDAVDAEAIAVDYLYTLVQKLSTEKEQTDWEKRLVENVLAKQGRVVLRTLYMSSKEYIGHLSSIKGWDDKTIPLATITALTKSLPEDLWVVEVSLPELFPANRRKLGEIVLDPSKTLTSDKDLSTFIFARLLQKLYCMQREGDSKLTLIVEKNLGIDTHTELYPRCIS